MPINSSSLNGVLMESVIGLEKHLGTIETKINSLFLSINNIMEYSFESGETIINISKDIKELKENLIYKDDLITQLAILHKEIGKLFEYMENNNKVFSEVIERLNNLEDIISGNKKTKRRP